MRQPHRVPWIDNFVQTLFTHLYPWRCLICDGIADQDYGLCRGCERSLPSAVWACPVCAHPTPALARCGSCLRAPPAFDGAYAAFRYAPPLSGLIHALKYRQRVDLATTLGRLLAHRVTPHLVVRPDVLIPVPLHRRRLRQRGFNQALELSRPLARALRLPIGFAVRRRDTPPQADLDAALRGPNVRGAFCPPPHFDARRAAIVDDVMTTGATADALARALKRAGARHVQVWVLARA